MDPRPAAGSPDDWFVGLLMVIGRPQMQRTVRPRCDSSVCNDLPHAQRIENPLGPDVIVSSPGEGQRRIAPMTTDSRMPSPK